MPKFDVNQDGIFSLSDLVFFRSSMEGNINYSINYSYNENNRIIYFKELLEKLEKYYLYGSIGIEDINNIEEIKLDPEQGDLAIPEPELEPEPEPEPE